MTGRSNAAFLFAMPRLAAAERGQDAVQGKAQTPDARQQGSPPSDFARDIAPIFQTSCYSCHNGDKAQGQLRLDSETAILKGGVSGKVVIAGDSQNSLLVKRLLGLGDAPRMPMGADPLPSENDRAPISCAPAAPRSCRASH